MKWTLISTKALVWRSWDEDEHVVFHSGSGDTHILNDVAAELLGLLDSASLTSLELADRCAEAFGIEPDASFREHVSESLAKFDELGLIEPAP